MSKMKQMLGIALLAVLVMLVPVQAQDTLLVDDAGSGFIAENPNQGDPWLTGTNASAINGGYHYFLRNSAGIYGQTAKWSIDVTESDQYMLYFHLPPTGNGRNKELYIVQAFGSAPDSQRFNQNENSGNWRILGMYQLFAGQLNYVQQVDDSVNTTGYACYADAVRAVKAKTGPAIESDRSARNGSQLIFGPANMGATKTMPHKIWNQGSEPLTITEITSLEGNFSYSSPSLPVTIPAYSSQEFNFTFSPNSERIFEDTLAIASNDPEYPLFDLPVTGEGTAVTVIVDNSSPPPIYEEIGTWSTSNGAAQCEGIPNETSRYALLSSGQEIAIYRPNIPQFSSYNVYYVGPATGNANTSALFMLYPFGSAPDSIRINQNAASACVENFVNTNVFFQGSVNEIHIVNDGLGTGYVTRADMLKIVSVPDRPKINIPQNRFSFFDVPKNGTADTTFIVKNLGLQDLVISAIATDEEHFNVIGTTFPVTLGYLEEGEFTVRFSPNEIGDYSAELTVESNDTDFPELPIYLSGNSIGYQLQVDDTDKENGLFESGLIIGGVRVPNDTTWTQSTSATGINGTSLFTPIATSPFAYARWTINAAQNIANGMEIWVSSIPSSNAAPHAPYLVEESGSGVVDTFIVDQTTTSTGNVWLRLQREGEQTLFNFIPGLPGYVTVVNDTAYTFPDTLAGAYALRADAVKITEPAPINEIEEIPLPLVPGTFALEQNYPNPFNPETQIVYELPVQGKVKLIVYDMLGREVRRLVDIRQVPGRYSVTWDGTNAFGERTASGVYFYKLEAPGWSKTKKMILLK